MSEEKICCLTYLSILPTKPMPYCCLSELSSARSRTWLQILEAPTSEEVDSAPGSCLLRRQLCALKNLLSQIYTKPVAVFIPITREWSVISNWSVVRVVLNIITVVGTTLLNGSKTSVSCSRVQIGWRRRFFFINPDSAGVIISVSSAHWGWLIKENFFLEESGRCSLLLLRLGWVYARRRWVASRPFPASRCSPWSMPCQRLETWKQNSW